MKNLIFIAVFIFNYLSIFGQQKVLPILKDGKWGVIDTEFNVVLPMIYDSIKVKRNIIILKKDSLYGVLSSTGKKITDISYSNINVENLHFFTAKKNNKLALFDYSGNKILDAKYSEIEIINQKIIKIKKDGLYTLFDIDSKKTIKYYDEIISEPYGYFILKKEEQKCLYIPEKQYKSKFYTKIEIKRDNIIFFYEDKTITVLETDKNFKLSKDENPSFSRINRNLYLLKIGKNYTFTNTFNKKSINIEIDKFEIIDAQKKDRRYRRDMASFLNKDNDTIFFKVFKNGKLGVLNLKCEIIIPIDYSKIDYDNNKFYVKTENYKKGLFTTTGKIIIQPIYSDFKRVVDLYIVKKNKKYGVVKDGKEIIPTSYHYIEAILNDMFIIKKRNRYGVIDIKGKTILKAQYDDIKALKKCFLFRKGDNNGIADFNGNIKINTTKYIFFKLQDDILRILNKNSESGKTGIVTIDGKVIFKPAYRNIKKTENKNIFYVSSFEYDELLKEDMNKMFKLKLNLRKDRKKEYFKFGLINSHGEILLDTLYYLPQIKTDFESNNIKAKIDTGMVVTTFEDNGKIIDKIKYKNYIVAKVRRIGKPNIWKRSNRKQTLGLWGLFTARGVRLIDYSYTWYSQNFMNKEDLVNTKNGKYNGVVNQKTGKIILPAYYSVINISDFTKASVARCLKKYGNGLLINRDCEIVKKQLGFVGDFSKNYTRANTKGKIIPVKEKNKEKSKRNYKYLLQVPGFDYSGMDNFFSNPSFCSGGKWGIMDTTGNFIVEPKYNFLQRYFRNEFIAQLDKKWGVISPNDSIKIDFIYDEIRYFFNDSAKKKWANIPYYKVRSKNKWGVIDSIGTVIIDTKFSEIEYSYNDDIFFITKIKEKEIIYGYIDTTGSVKIKHNFYEAGEFKEGKASIKIAKNKYSFINKSGEQINKTTFRRVYDFRDNAAAVMVRNKWGFIDTTGKIIIKPRFSKVGSFGDGLAPVFVRKKRFFGLIKSITKSDFIDKSGNIVIETRFKNCTNFSNGFSIVRKRRRYGIIDTTGEYLVRPKYKNIKFDEETKYFIIKGNRRRFAIMDKNGDFIVPFGKYNYIGQFSEGLCIVKKRFKKGQAYGYIDKTGKEKIKLTYQNAKDFKDGLAAVKRNNKWQYIDTSATQKIYKKPDNINIPRRILKRKKIKRVYNNVFIIKAKNKKYGLINQNSDQMFYPFAKDIKSFSENFAAYGIEKTYGLYDKKGKCIVKTKALLIEPVGNKIFRVQNINEMKYCK